MDAWLPARNPKAPNLREGSALKGCKSLWALLGGPWEPPRSHGHYRKASRHVGSGSPRFSCGGPDMSSNRLLRFVGGPSRNVLGPIFGASSL